MCNIQTFLFSIEAPSPPPTPVVGPEPAEHLLSPGLMGVPGSGGSTNPGQQPHLSANQRRRRFSHASPLNAIATPSLSTLTSRRSNCSFANNSSLRVGVPAGDELDEEEEEEARRNRRVRRSASILSMTSQVGKYPKKFIYMYTIIESEVNNPSCIFGEVLMT